MIRQRISVDIRHDCLKRNHFFVDQILNLVLEVDIILNIMSNAVRVILTPLIGFEEFGTSIHRLGPHGVNISSRSQSLVQLCSAFRECSEVPGRLLLEFGWGRVITA